MILDIAEDGWILAVEERGFSIDEAHWRPTNYF